MIFTSKRVAFIVSLFVAIIATLSCAFFDGAVLLLYLTVGGSTFFASFLISYIVLEITVFKELRNVYQRIVNLEDEREDLLNTIEKVPVQTMSNELFKFSEKKTKELKKMKEVETFRRQFLADIAHELKTPVHTAQGYLETLIDGAIDDLDVRDRFLNKTRRSLENLEFIIRDLINISHLETGEVRLDINKYDLVELIERTTQQLEEKAKKKNKTIHLEYNGEQPFYVDVDEFRVGQVFTNLINNSLNYSGENENLWVRVNEDDNGDYLVEIEDDGIGIDEEHQKKIFNRFYRVDKSRSREHGGTGLGLAIVKHILEAHKSKIKLQSSLGHGAKFHFKLRRSRAFITLSTNKGLTARGRK